MEDIPEVIELIDELLKDSSIEQCIVSTIDGSPIYGKSKKKGSPGEGLYTIPAAIASALAISNNFLTTTLKDSTNEYVVFQQDCIIVATKASDVVLITSISLPRTSFEKRPAIDVMIEKLRDFTDKLDAIVKTLHIKDTLIEMVQRAIPEAKSILLLSSAGVPLSSLSSLDVDSAQLAAVSSAISLPTRMLGKEPQSIAVTGKNHLILLYSLDAERILMVSLKPKHSIESYLTTIARIVEKQ
ncbi:MAG: hypothetical protein ACTSPV_02125 [Candidatus Hodarchaeales archaeon]